MEKSLTQPAFPCSLQEWKHQKIGRNLFKVSYKKTRHQQDVNDAVLVSLLLNFEHISHIVLVFALLPLNT